MTWLQSYMSQRTQCVSVKSAVSGNKALTFGVPQGSVLGPVLYCLYSKPMGEICRRHGMPYHDFADDKQVYKIIHIKDDSKSAMEKIESCLVDISEWTSANGLKLNEDKTELIVFRPKTFQIYMPQ